MKIEKQYIVDEKNSKFAVQLSLETYKKIEETLENFALFKLMDGHDDELLTASDAIEFYSGQEKAK
ncbi:MAG: hypothetical protein ACNA7V_02965 [Bacteroidales bacterium]